MYRFIVSKQLGKILKPATYPLLGVFTDEHLSACGEPEDLVAVGVE